MILVAALRKKLSLYDSNFPKLLKQREIGVEKHTKIKNGRLYFNYSVQNHNLLVSRPRLDAILLLFITKT